MSDGAAMVDSRNYPRGRHQQEAAMRIQGILETALYVSNPRHSAAFYRQLFDFPVLLDSERLVALNVANRQVLLLFQRGATSEPFVTGGGTIPGHGSSGCYHFAFAIDRADIDGWLQRLERLGVAIESRVDWSAESHSIYFRDPDQHLVELITPGFWKLPASTSVSSV